MIPLRTFALCILALMSLQANSKDVIEKYGPFNVDGGKETCHSSSGDEIKKYQTFETSGDRFFRNFKVDEVSGWAPKEHSCSIASIEEKEITVTSNDGGYSLKVRVPFKYTVFAHSDCGSGYGPLGKTISIECVVSAETVKYSDR